MTSDASAGLTRAGITSSTAPKMTIGAGVTITGTSLTLDSTYGADLANCDRIVFERVRIHPAEGDALRTDAVTASRLNLLP